VVWLAASGGLIALGRFDRHALVTAVGVLSMIGAICALLMDLGLDLRAAAGVFLVCAILAMIAGFMLRKRASA
jgi:formate-dependent nitrite reductase membrane component NrfD